MSFLKKKTRLKSYDFVQAHRDRTNKGRYKTMLTKI